MEFFQALEQPQLDCLVYSNDPGWTVLQVFAHLISAEKAFSLLIEDILSGGPGAPETFDIDRFNEEEMKELSSLAMGELVIDFQKSRALNIRQIAELSLEDLARVGRHPFLGMTSLEEIIKLLYRHNQIHQRDVRRFLNPRLAGSVE